MKKTIKILGLALLLQGCYSTQKLIPHKKFQVPDSALNVQWDGGTLDVGYNKGPLYSKNFFSCSALILDYGEDALLSHSSWSYGLVDSLIKESKKRGLDPKESFAVVNGGKRQSLNEIVKDLKKNNIPIKKKIKNFRTLKRGIGRNIIYFPKQNSLKIYSWR